MQIEWRALESLIPYARNARTHSDEQVGQIAASMTEFGFTNPVLTDSAGALVAGHGRLLGAKRVWDAGGEIPRCPRGTVPCIALGDLSEDQRRAYALADNKIALNAGWDFDLLRAELLELDQVNFDLALTGFSEAEVEQMMTWAPETSGLTDPDDVPQAPADPVTVAGDVWVLGRHRTTCGDSTSATDVARVLAGVQPHLMVTDPPYGVEYDADWRSSLDPVKRSIGKVKNDDRADWRDAWALFPGNVMYVWHAGLNGSIVQQSLEHCGFGIRSQIIWIKPHFVISRGHYHVQHEPCWYAVRKGDSGHWSGDRTQSTTWQIANGTFQGGKRKPEDAKSGHGTQKPVECMRRPIENNSSPGQAVYEPFSGSGTTIIAAEMSGRACYAIELNPAYVDVAVKRWQEFTGKQAVLEGTGQTFDEVARGRGVKVQDDEGQKAEADAPEAGHRERRTKAAQSG